MGNTLAAKGSGGLEAQRQQQAQRDDEAQQLMASQNAEARRLQELGLQQQSEANRLSQEALQAQQQEQARAREAAEQERLQAEAEKRRTGDTRITAMQDLLRRNTNSFLRTFAGRSIMPGMSLVR